MIRQDIQSTDPGALIELFEIDATALGGSIEHFCAGTDDARDPVVFDGETYAPWPLEASGFEYSARGQAPTPRIKLSNIGGAMTVLALAYDDLVGAKITRRRTFYRYLDGQPDEDPTAQFPEDIFYVERKVSESRLFIEWELSSPMDVEGVLLPKRQVIANLCSWGYRSAECSYAGGPVAKANDDPTSDAELDVCGKRLSSCKLRFGAYGPLPTSAFPGVGKQ